MNEAFVLGFLDELEKQGKAGALSRTYSGAKIPRSRLKRTLMRTVSPTVSGRAMASTQLRLLRKIERRLDPRAKSSSGRMTSQLSKEIMAMPESRRLAKIQFAINRVMGAGALAGGGAIAHRLLKKKKKKSKK